ncbi:MAG: alkylhydroperoxidase-related (seleno)protein, partial [bacterium]
MAPFDYGDSGIRIRDDLAPEHTRIWQRLAAPGAAWSGAQRVAIVEESRRAVDCELCRTRKA